MGSLCATTYSPGLFNHSKVNFLIRIVIVLDFISCQIFLHIFDHFIFLFAFQKNVGCQTPKKSFNWSIGQLADFHPVIIDETTSECQISLVLIHSAF